MQGLHLTADLRGCRCEPQCLLDAEALLAFCHRAAVDVGLTAVAQLTHAFNATAHGPGGVTATVLLAESHLCIHTWPEHDAVTLDVFVCNVARDHSVAAEQLLCVLIEKFEPAQCDRQRLSRGSITT